MEVAWATSLQFASVIRASASAGRRQAEITVPSQRNPPEGAPLRTVHRDCGADVRVNLVCDDGHQVDSPRTVVPRPRPGVRPMSSVRESTADEADAHGGARRTVEHDDEAAIDHASSQHRRTQAVHTKT